MVVVKVIHKDGQYQANVTKQDKYHDDYAYWDVIGYILRPDKITLRTAFSTTKYVGSFLVDLQTAPQQMAAFSKAVGKDFGLRLRHIILSFVYGDFYDLDTQGTHESRARRLFEIASYIAAYYGREYQTVYAIHFDSEKNVNVHIVFNTVSTKDHHKYVGNLKDYYDFQHHLRACLATVNLQFAMARDESDLPIDEGGKSRIPLIL